LSRDFHTFFAVFGEKTGLLLQGKEHSMTRTGLAQNIEG